MGDSSLSPKPSAHKTDYYNYAHQDDATPSSTMTKPTLLNFKRLALGPFLVRAYLAIYVVFLHASTHGIETPILIQSGMVGNCDTFYKVKEGDGCSNIVGKYRITLKQFIAWNPRSAAGAPAGLGKDVYVCTSIIGHTPRPTEPDNSIKAPMPVHPSMVKVCDAFYRVKSGV
ncbi:hypothetical protein DL765_011599 [Monosporascus sp. GIB2]|nr:hypothetical protein DL765_011599 [Monosporascus sp. GIB2]